MNKKFFSLLLIGSLSTGMALANNEMPDRACNTVDNISQILQIVTQIQADLALCCQVECCDLLYDAVSEFIRDVLPILDTDDSDSCLSESVWRLVYGSAFFTVLCKVSDFIPFCEALNDLISSIQCVLTLEESSSMVDCPFFFDSSTFSCEVTNEPYFTLYRNALTTLLDRLTIIQEECGCLV